MSLPDYDDIDIDIDPEEELRALADSIQKDEEADEETEVDDESEGETSGDEGDEGSEDGEAPEDSKKPEALSEMDQLRLEKIRLHEQLNATAMLQAQDGRKLAELEKALAEIRSAPQKNAAPEEDGPTPEQILAHLDQRITVLDKALAKAEIEDVEKAPAIRAQLRQLERYYNDYKTNVVLEMAKGPDPQLLVQQAAEEAQTQARFDAVTKAVKAEYPNLDPKSEYFNAKFKDEVYSIYQPLLAAGRDPTESLIKAVTLTAKGFNIKSMSEYAAEQQALQQKAADPVKKGADRKKEAVARNTKVAKAVAPSLADVGASNSSEGKLGKYDFGKMGINEFMRISDDEQEQLEELLRFHEV